MLEWVVPALFAALACTAGYRDVRYRTIPNSLNASLAVLGLGVSWYTGGGGGVAMAATHFALALAIGLAVYAMKMWGGGDAKFYAATAAWFPLRDFPSLLIAISLAGLLLLIGWFATKRFRRGESAAGLKGDLPYGLAVAAGGIVQMTLSTLPQAGT
jgi:prepilin peptidase CpaA